MSLGGEGEPTSPSAAQLTSEEHTLDFADLTFDAVIGRGAFGTVSRGTLRGAGAVAIKALAVRALVSASMEKYLHGELAALRAVSHAHLIRYHGAAARGREIYIVTEFMAGGPLTGVLAPGAPLLPWSLLVALARAAADGLAHLHAAGLLHRDIKTENLLLDDAWRVVIADYGFAKQAAAAASAGAPPAPAAPMTILGTEAFMAPEVQFGEAYGAAADVFALGCVLAELLTRRAPGAAGFLERGPRTHFAVDADAMRAAAPADAPPSLVECALQCLATEPDARLAADMTADWLRELEGELAAQEAAHEAAEDAGGAPGAAAAQGDAPRRLRRSQVPAPSVVSAAAKAAAAAAAAAAAPQSPAASDAT